jgi:hypothetical protein
MFRNFRKKRLYNRIIKQGQKARSYEVARRIAASWQWHDEAENYQALENKANEKLERLRERYFAL